MANLAQTLFFPYELGLTTSVKLTSMTLNQYPVDIATSARSVETRTLLPGGREKGSISLELKYVEDLALETLIQFYDICSGPLIAFEIRDDHPIMTDGIPAFSRYHWHPFWRFDGTITFSADTSADIDCLFNVSLNLLNVLI